MTFAAKKRRQVGNELGGQRNTKQPGFSFQPESTSVTEPEPELDHETARALAEAGYMSLQEYLLLCSKNGWSA